MSLSEYEIYSQTESVQQLYLSSLITVPSQIFDFDPETTDTRDRAHLWYLQSRRHEQVKKSTPAQLALAFRFEHGIKVEANCESAVAYMEQSARLTTEFVEKTYGLYTVERDKLNLLGPFVLSESSMQIKQSIQANTNSLDIIDLLDL